jgi:uncharacterized protein YqeY
MPTNPRERLRTQLTRALGQRDAEQVAVLRATLAAIENAEAVPAQTHGSGLEARPLGVGVRDVPRRELSDDDVAHVIRAEIAERRSAAAVYEQAGRPDHARRLRQEAATLADLTGLSG